MPGSLRDIAFKTDETRFKQIIINLLSNAIKFTDNGGEIKLLAEIRHIGEDALLTVTVRDNGIGMSESEIARLFQRFTQADASTTRKYGGTGLGLAISRNLARLMDGDLSVFSVKHQGSDFTLQLPFEQLTIQIDDSNNVLPALSLDENLRILVVDDLPMNLTMMVMMLKKLGFEADTATNGLEAVKRQASESYDLIFMDWEMPELDGVEATRRIRNLNGADNKPWIIALTANASTTHKEACIKAGMNDYLAKPVSIDQIANKLKQVSA
jgi:CheY-like chemotaxis protein